ncbi:MAG: imidazole glycerol phosphate synthase subunit HisF [Rhodothermales bacterium]|nr:imidazole glycerol phosphate synthase subunit HisF [Rhodothermales bacterium]MDG2016097.1 imidazole glycerol phosphate synthase subunit HisF [Rhodothermales bacterium]HAY36844.1 imidazole glycerol phosphate synthase subunit HisF [Bacteroidota bacterium]
MLTKRIIPCLDIQNGRTVKGVNFINLRDAGDPVQLARSYVQQGADELVFLDIAASLETRGTLLDLVRRVAEVINIPFTVGGGVRTVDDVRDLLQAGADKVAINSSAISTPDLISDMAAEFGSQCVVVAIDIRQVEGEWLVHSHGGTRPTELRAEKWAGEVEQRGAGEILLTSMDHDGTKNGFALDITDRVSRNASIPVIASGGAGSMIHFVEVFQNDSADAALAASIFHFEEISIPDLKSHLHDYKIPVRL